MNAFFVRKQNGGKMSKTVVNHWRYNDGWHVVPTVFQKDHTGQDLEFTEELVGWHCWVYPEDDLKFKKWMEENMKGVYDCTFRFNGGSPMYTVLIKENEDATLFKLTWL